jgi:hypothetical protein
LRLNEAHHSGTPAEADLLPNAARGPMLQFELTPLAKLNQDGSTTSLWLRRLKQMNSLN